MIRTPLTSPSLANTQGIKHSGPFWTGSFWRRHCCLVQKEYEVMLAQENGKASHILLMWNLQQGQRGGPQWSAF